MKGEIAMKSKDVFGYAGKMARINLSSGEIKIENTLDYAEDWLGGSGIAIKILYDELKPWVTPYEPANKIIFSSAPLIGTVVPGANKMSVSTLGPMTGGWATGSSDSYVGGQLKFAGYDAIIVEGKASTPVYLWIHNNEIEIRDAQKLWGRTTWETLDGIREELENEDLHIISIGPAGENLVRGACIIQDKGRAFGRCGMGAVMGSKNLKALVADGNQPINIAFKKEFFDAAKRSREMILSDPSTERVRRKYGTLVLLEGKQRACSSIYKNFQYTYIPEEVAAKIDPKKIVDKYQISRQNYPGCPIGCSKILYIDDGPYAPLEAEAPQWEVVGTLQTRLAIEDPTFFVKANALCNQLGLDVDAAGGPIGWAMECYQRGIIDEKDTDGLKLNWGDAEVTLELIKRISYRKGFGNILAEGCAKASDIIGRNSQYYALHIKGQDLYEPCRGANAWSLGTTVSTRGGGHTTSAPVFETTANAHQLQTEKAKEIFGTENTGKPQEYEGKAQMVYFTEILTRINNSLGICHFNTVWTNLNFMNLAELAELYSYATGIKRTVEDFKKIALRQINLEKSFNLRHTNFGKKDDMPTPRDLEEEIKTGSLAGWKIDKSKYERMLEEYYDLHGWDTETSYPTRKTLTELGLEYVADDLEKIGKLGKPKNSGYKK